MAIQRVVRDFVSLEDLRHFVLTIRLDDPEALKGYEKLYLQGHRGCTFALGESVRLEGEFVLSVLAPSAISVGTARFYTNKPGTIENFEDGFPVWPLRFVGWSGEHD